ncbi:MAG: hypothetical protein PF505_03745, partial [Vallitaleaceae bacterium]|nr:hypothetical protein [Vallitaleaceae bacterium]
EKESIAVIESVLKSKNPSLSEVWPIIKKREVDAWELGRRFVPYELLDLYETINFINLEYRYCHTKMNILKQEYIAKCEVYCAKNLELVKKNKELLEKSMLLKYGEDFTSIIE